ncbi:MAG: hypothetical protein KAT66_02040 [Candidatus Lokiarchaeota archaeon]|nr:hypothetical protein [Candidatus Lokiarchaeota archaeon]
MTSKVDWTKYFKIDLEKNNKFINLLGAKKIYAMGLMPIRGPMGFRKLDYEFTEKELDVKKVMSKI